VVTSLKTSVRALISIAVLSASLAAPAATAADGDAIVLGAAVSLTGKYSIDGKYTKDGYDLAVRRINELGGVKLGGKSHELKILYYDDESTSARGAELVERLINQDHVQFVLGPYSSGLTKAIAPITEKYKIPMIEGNGSDRTLFTNGYKYLFAILNTSDFYLRPAIRLVAEETKQAGKNPTSLKVGIVIENDDGSQDVREGVIEEATK
jgi:branched-chain amino acid transport system substrate-binding protein